MKKILKAVVFLMIALVVLTGCDLKSRFVSSEIGSVGQVTAKEDSKTSDGYNFTQIWDKEGQEGGDISFTDHPNGRYELEWECDGEDGNPDTYWLTVCGKGWGYNASGSNTRFVQYYGSFDPDESPNPNPPEDDYQNAYLAFYGWSENPKIEYYVLDSWGEYNHSMATGDDAYDYVTSYESLNTEYRLYSKARNDETPFTNSGQKENFTQLVAIRDQRVGFGNVGGRIKFSDHLNAWNDEGFGITGSYFQILATEANQSNGSSDITVNEGGTYIADDEFGQWVADIEELLPQLNGSYFYGGSVMTSNGDHRGSFSPTEKNFATVERNGYDYPVGNLAAWVSFSGIPSNPPAGRYVDVDVNIQMVEFGDEITAGEYIDKKYFPHPKDWVSDPDVLDVIESMSREDAIQELVTTYEDDYGWPWIASMNANAEFNVNGEEYLSTISHGEAKIDLVLNQIMVENVVLNGTSCNDFTIRFMRDNHEPVLVAYYTCQGDDYNSGRLALDLTNVGSSIVLAKSLGPIGSLIKYGTGGPQPVETIVRFQNVWTARILTLSNETEYGDRLLKAQPWNSGWNTQQWAVEGLDDGSGAVRLRNLNDNEYLTIRSNGNNASVITQPLHESWDSQKWYLSDAGNGQVRLKTLWAPDKALNVGEKNDYANVVSYCINNTWNSQKWNVITE